MLNKKRFQKTKTAILLFLILILLWIASDIILNKMDKGQYYDLDQTDRVMLNELSMIYKNFKENGDKLWNKDYKLNEKPMVIVRANALNGLFRGQAYAINVAGLDNSIFSKKIIVPDSMELPPVYRISKFDLSTFPAWMPVNFGTLKLSNEDVFYFRYDPEMIENPNAEFDFSLFLIHESFHIYKQKDWIYDKDDAEYISNYPNNIENYALMGLGFNSLDKCLETEDLNKVNNYLEEWTIVQTYRYSKWPQLKNETNSEAIEGAATYLEDRYSKLTGKRTVILPGKNRAYQVPFVQAFEFIAEGKAKSPAYLKRQMKYETGAALGIIMDKLNIDWKSKIEDSQKRRGKTQYQILKEHFNINDTDVTEAKLLEIKDDNDYNTLLKYSKKIVDSSLQSLK